MVMMNVPAAGAGSKKIALAPADRVPELFRRRHGLPASRPTASVAAED